MPARLSSTPTRVPEWLWAIAIVVLVAAIYAPTLGYQFVDFDDRNHLVLNSYVNAGLTWKGLCWSWGLLPRSAAQPWWSWPLTWMTHMADFAVFGNWAGGHHLTSVALHAAGSVVLMRFLRQAGFSAGTGFVLAGVYAIHPSQLESVAWVISRKNVLSALFFYMTISWYLEARSPSRRTDGRVAWACWNLCAIAAMLSKATVTTLPAVLLLLDVWPARRVTWRDWRSQAWPLVSEKLVVIAAAVAVTMMGFESQRVGGAAHFPLPLSDRLGHAAVSLWAYVAMFLWPFDLSPMILHPGAGPGAVAGWAAVVAGVVVTGCLGWLAARHGLVKYGGLVTGWLWFCGMLVPMLGIVQLGSHGMACRHLQIPMVGLLIMTGTAASSMLTLSMLRRRIAVLLSAAWLVVCGCETLVQMPVWRDAVSLSATIVRHNPRSAVHVMGYAMCLDRHGAPEDEAERWFQRALELSPNHPEMAGELAYDFGVFMLKRRHDAAARELLARSVELTDDPTAEHYDACRVNLAVVLTRLGEASAAARTIESLHRERPASSSSWVALGNARATLGEWTAAAEAFSRAADLDPNDVVLLCDAAKAAFRSGDSALARRYLFQAASIAPDAAAVREARTLIEE